METRNVLHLGLILPTLGALLFSSILFSKSSDYRWSEDSFRTSATSAWAHVFDAMPAEMPTEYFSELDELQDAEDDSDRLSTDGLEPALIASLAETNAFIVTCSLLMLAGFIGIGLVCGAKTTGEPAWNPLLRIGTILCFALLCVTYFGFNVAYPGDFNGAFSLGWVAVPEDVDPVEYGLDGMSIWTDAFYFACYVAVLGVLAVTTTAGRQTATSAFVMIAPIVVFVGPLVVSWKWGGGWLDTLGTYDFAGAGLFHWHAGVVVLGTGAILKLFRRPYTRQLDPAEVPTLLERAPLRLGWWLPGMALYFLLIVGMNAGSTLSAQPDLVAAVLQCTGYAALAGAVAATMVGGFLKSRSLVEWAGLGLLSGGVAVSGATDLITGGNAIAFGAAAGVLAPFAIYSCDRWLALDPLGVFGVHGIGGLIGMLGAVGSGSDYETSALGQLVFLAVTPLLSLSLVLFFSSMFGLARFLFFDRPIEPPYEHDGTPPPLPRR